jgi:hypothetical protein
LPRGSDTLASVSPFAVSRPSDASGGVLPGVRTIGTTKVHVGLQAAVHAGVELRVQTAAILRDQRVAGIHGLIGRQLVRALDDHQVADHRQRRRGASKVDLKTLACLPASSYTDTSSR